MLNYETNVVLLRVLRKFDKLLDVLIEIAEKKRDGM